MVNGWLWVVSGSGIPYCINQVERPDSLSDVEWRACPISEKEHVKVVNIACIKESAFAVDHSGDVYIFSKPNVIAIRKKVDHYQNQRWYPFVGWKKPLITERSEYSTENGETITPLAFSLPSEGWRWEEKWSIRVNNQTDKEVLILKNKNSYFFLFWGWEYAIGFGMNVKWKNSQGFGCLVRRRLVKRYMRYVAVGRWSKLPDYGIQFLSLSAGCTSVAKEGGCFLFGLTNDGTIYNRLGISCDAPEGVDWFPMEKIESIEGEVDDIVFLTVSPHFPTLIAGTWDGQLYWRMGIDKVTPNGIVWRPLPTPKSLAVVCATVGNNALWVTTVEGQVWMHKLELNNSRSQHNLNSVHSSTYQQVCSQKRQLSAASSGDIFCLNYENKVEVREGISSDEPAGRTFIPLIERTTDDENSWSLVSASGCSSVPNYWTSKSVRIGGDLNYRTTEWRQEILRKLVEQNDKYIRSFNSMCANLDSQQCFDSTKEEDWEMMDGWVKSIKVKLKLRTDKIYQDGVIRMDEEVIEISTAKTSWRKTYKELQIAEEFFDKISLKYCLGIVFFETDYYQVAFTSEAERDIWTTLLQNIIVNSLATAPRDRNFTAAWSVSSEGTIRCHPLNELYVDSTNNTEKKSLSHLKSVMLPGHFKCVSAGTERIVWAINTEGTPYCLDQSWSPFQTNEFDYSITDTKTIEIMEYQRSAFLRGFIPIMGLSNGISAWMEGNSPTSGKNYRLPSKKWSWLDDEWKIIYEYDSDDEGWKYSNNAQGPYGSLEQGKTTKFRARMWRRMAKFQSQGPWIKVDGPTFQTIHVQQQASDMIFVWGLTKSGDLLLRQGVMKEQSLGFVWKQIFCDYRIRLISIESEKKIWAITADNRILERYCDNQIDMECIDWSELETGKLALPSIDQFQVVPGKIWFVSSQKLHLLDIKQGKFVCVASLTEKANIFRDTQGLLYITSSWNTERLVQLKIIPKSKPNSVSYECIMEKLITGFAKNFSIC